MRRTIFDPDCCHYQVRLNDWALAWAITVVDADTETGLVVVAYREDGDGPVVPIDQIPNADGAEWFGERLIVAEHQHGKVELAPVTQLDAATQNNAAYWQGRVDASMGRSNWGGSHYPDYGLRAWYDKGYREGLIP